jgi:hypothetical protein
MMYAYKVRVDFGDNAVSESRGCMGESELASYLETVPGMIGFEVNRQATITIETFKHKKETP